jgi:hypothetical protein
MFKYGGDGGGDANTTIDAIEAISSAKFANAGASRGLIVLDYLQILPLGRNDSPATIRVWSGCLAA